MSNLRDTVLAQEDMIASKRRFGLFSQAAPLAVGDDSKYKQIQHPRGQNGKPITKPPQLLAGSCKTGQIKSSYFGVPESIYAKDPYKERYKEEIQYQRKMHTKANFHQNDFKPASGTKTIDKPAYKYIQQKQNTQKKARKDQNGRVKTEPRNFTTNQISTVQSQMFKPPKYIQDPYERKLQFAKKEKEIFKSKLPSDTPAFKSMSHARKTLDKDSKVYGLDNEAKELLAKSQGKRIKTESVHMYPHQTKFKLARRGFGDPFGPYPQFIEKKTNETMTETRKVKKQEGGRQLWKHNKPALSRPTPSISLHPSNLHVGRYK